MASDNKEYHPLYYIGEAMTPLKAAHEDRLKALVAELVGDCRNPEKLLGKDGLPKRMTQRLVECILQAEMSNRPA